MSGRKRDELFTGPVTTSFGNVLYRVCMTRRPETDTFEMSRTAHPICIMGSLWHFHTVTFRTVTLLEYLDR